MGLARRLMKPGPHRYTRARASGYFVLQKYIRLPGRTEPRELVTLQYIFHHAGQAQLPMEPS